MHYFPTAVADNLDAFRLVGVTDVDEFQRRVKRIKSLVRDVMHGLEALHANQLAHLDLSIRNILVVMIGLLFRISAPLRPFRAHVRSDSYERAYVRQNLVIPIAPM